MLACSKLSPTLFASCHTCYHCPGSMLRHLRFISDVATHIYSLYAAHSVLWYTDWNARSLTRVNLLNGRMQPLATGLMRPSQVTVHYSGSVPGMDALVILMLNSWANASACRLQVSLSCAILCHIVSLQYLSRLYLHRLADLPCRLLLSYGLQLVKHEVRLSSTRRLMCSAQDHYDLCPLPGLDTPAKLMFLTTSLRHSNYTGMDN